jgi:hypothetical protein
MSPSVRNPFLPHRSSEMLHWAPVLATEVQLSKSTCLINVSLIGRAHLRRNIRSGAVLWRVYDIMFKGAKSNSIEIGGPMIVQT